jgi:hypothetical protein
MKVTQVSLDVPMYDIANGIQFKWEENFEIKTAIENGVVKISANKDGLVSLANHLLNLAQDLVPSGRHIHLDKHNSLEDESVDLIIEKA